MSAFSINITPSSKQALLRLSGAAEISRRAIRQTFFDIGKLSVKETKRLIIQGPKTGNYYKIVGRKLRHRASAPGEAPANLTGNLQRHAGFQLRGELTMAFGIRDVNYAPFLEEGTSKMEKRPYIVKAAENTREAARSVALERIRLEHEARLRR